MLHAGNHVWNSGILLTFPETLKKHFADKEPEMVDNVKGLLTWVLKILVSLDLKILGEMSVYFG